MSSSFTTFSCAVFNLIAVFVCLQCVSLTSAQSLATPESFNYTQLQTSQFSTLVSTCKVVDQINRMAALNVTDYSEARHVQLQAMKITGAQVKENICDWITAVIVVDVQESNSCSDSKLTVLCDGAKNHARN